MTEDECPYGPNECPKLSELGSLREDIMLLREAVASLTASLKTMAWVCGLVVTIGTSVGIVL